LAGTTLMQDDDLDRILVRFWQKGVRRDFTGTQFWGMVQSHLTAIEATPDRGGITLLLGHTSPDLMALFIALIAAGRLAALFPPNTPLQDEAAYFHQQHASFSKIDPAEICILDPSLAGTIARIDPVFGARTRLVQPAADVTAPAAALHAAAIAARTRFRAQLSNPDPIFVQHSSGTTGIKKAVAISGQALAAQFHAYWPGLRQQCGGGTMAIASWLPLYHDMGLITSLLLPLLGGDTVSIVDPFEWIGNPGLLFDMIAEDGCTVTWLPNFAFRHLVRLRAGLERRPLASMRMWIDCSEPCRFADAAAFERDFAEWGVRPGSVLGCYAMAETVFAATQCAFGEQRALAVPHAVQPGADLLAEGALVVHDEAGIGIATGADGAGKLVLSSGCAVPGMGVARAEGIYGELALHARFLFAGYRGMSQAESSIGEDGYFRTGDLGTIIDGHVFVFGRLKEIIIVNGKNLFAGDIEDVLNGIPGIRKGRVVAFGFESAQTGSEELVVVAERDPQADMPPSQTRMDISRAVQDQFLIKPRDVRIVDDRWLIKSTSGKISRDENLRKYIQSFRTKPVPVIS
jgi:fatty-acyl-CoA synthase